MRDHLFATASVRESSTTQRFARLESPRKQHSAAWTREGGTTLHSLGVASGSPLRPRRKSGETLASAERKVRSEWTAKSVAPPVGRAVGDRVMGVMKQRAITISDAFHRLQGVDGYVHRSQLHAGLERLGVHVQREESDALFAHLDTGRTGHLGWAEFVAIVGESSSLASSASSPPSAASSPARRAAPASARWCPVDSMTPAWRGLRPLDELREPLASTPLGYRRSPPRGSPPPAARSDEWTPTSPTRAPPPRPPIDVERHLVACAARALLVARARRRALEAERAAALRDAESACAAQARAAERAVEQRAERNRLLLSWSAAKETRAASQCALAAALKDHRALDERLVEETGHGELATTASGEEPGILRSLRASLNESAAVLKVDMAAMRASVAAQRAASAASAEQHAALASKHALRAELAAELKAARQRRATLSSSPGKS